MFSWLEPGRLPLIVAHRGSSSVAPENTLASFRQAIRDGADAVECDVRLTADGHVVVFHDADLHRTTGGPGLISKHTLPELRTLSAGTWFHNRFAAERIPTLDEVIELTAGKCLINLEIKTAERESQEKIGEKLVDLCFGVIRRHGARESALITSFSHRAVKRAGLIRPRIATGLLYHPLRHVMKSPVRFARSLGARYLIMGGSILRRRIVEEAHERGILVGEYTVNTARRWERSMRFGVDAVFTDSPAIFRNSKRLFARPPDTCPETVLFRTTRPGAG